MKEMLDGLERHKKKLWTKIQNRLTALLASVNLTVFQVFAFCSQVSNRSGGRCM